jgi:DnaJ family protein C protein 3
MLAQCRILNLRKKLTTDNTKGFYEFANLLYQFGQVQDSLKDIRERLKLDPEHNEYFSVYKIVEKLGKFMDDAEAIVESNDLETCIDKSNSMLQHESSIDNVRLTALRLFCKCYTEISEGQLLKKIVKQY